MGWRRRAWVLKLANLAVQVEIAKLEELDLRRLFAHEEGIVVPDALLVLREESADPPRLCADLDRAVVVRLDHDALALGIAEREARSVLADDAGDLLRRHDRLAVRVDVGEVGRHREREVGLRRDDRLAVLAGADHVELAFAVRTQIHDLVLTSRLVDHHRPLLVLRLHCRPPVCPKLIGLLGASPQRTTRFGLAHLPRVLFGRARTPV